MYNRFREQGLSTPESLNGELSNSFLPFSASDASKLFKHFFMENQTNQIKFFSGNNEYDIAPQFCSSKINKKIEPKIFQVFCSLEELFSGQRKRLIIPRIINGMQSRKVMKLFIEAGSEDGDIISFPGEGDVIPGYDPQDLNFIIREKTHSSFIREGENLICNLSIDLNQPICGLQFNRIGLDGKEITLKIEDIVHCSNEQILTGEGMPNKKGGRGDMIFKFNIIPSDPLSSVQRSIYYQGNISI